MSTLGQKIKYFRERIGLKQMDVELDAGLSNGMLCRIEKDEVNPTKETVNKIANVLNLKFTEVVYLTTPEKLFPSIEEQNRVKERMKPIMDSNGSYSYIVDNLSRIVYFSDRFKTMMKQLGIDFNTLIGRYILELILKPELKVRGLFSEDGVKSMSLKSLQIVVNSNKFLLDNGEMDDLKKSIKEYMDIDSIDISEMSHNEGWMKTDNMLVEFIVFGRKVDFKFSTQEIYFDSRFSLVEYTPNNKLIKFLSKLF